MKIKLTEQVVEVPDNVGASMLKNQTDKDVLLQMIRTDVAWSFEVSIPIHYVDEATSPTALSRIKELHEEFIEQGDVEEAAGMAHAIDILEGKD